MAAVILPRHDEVTGKIIRLAVIATSTEDARDITGTNENNANLLARNIVAPSSINFQEVDLIRDFRKLCSSYYSIALQLQYLHYRAYRT